MALFTLSSLRTNIGSTTRETQVNSLIDDFINLTGLQIHNFHPWSWLRRKTTFSTVASQEDYNLDAEVDRIALLRQITSPWKLQFLPDQFFYRYISDPENRGTGTPRYYRRWEETSFTTNLAAADTIFVVSSSTSDGSSFKVVVTGRNSAGDPVTESITLNGTTNVTSTTTFAASGLLHAYKSATTTGTITIGRTTGSTTLATIPPSDITIRSKRISLFPIPSAIITMYLEYYEAFRPMLNDNDGPAMDVKWQWVLREGALAKMWEYKQNESATIIHQRLFEQGLEQMRREDASNPDYVPVLEPRLNPFTPGTVRLGDSVSNGFPSYALVV